MKNKKISKQNYIYIILGICFVAITVVVLVSDVFSAKEQYLLQNGTLESTEFVTAYVIKNEKIIEKDTSKTIVPVLSNGSKAQKGGIIATYKGKEYENYEETLAEMDKEILEAMQDLPTVYSSEIDTLDLSIYSLISKIDKETSTAKMQEYKQKINNNINKRATIIGELSPKGASVRKLIEERNEYEEKAKKSNDNILAPITGIVSYSTDGLEEKLNISNIENLTYSKIQSLVNENTQSISKNIKVVNNYEAYIVTKVSKKNVGYIEENNDYTLRLIEDSNYELEAELVKFVENEEEIELYFKITNGIEELVDLRDIEIEIVWWQRTGMIVLNTAVFEENGISYINVIKYSETVKIPVKVLRKNDTYSMVTNYDYEELEELGISTDYEIKLHDRVVID